MNILDMNYTKIDRDKLSGKFNKIKTRWGALVNQMNTMRELIKIADFKDDVDKERAS